MQFGIFEIFVAALSRQLAVLMVYVMDFFVDN